MLACSRTCDLETLGVLFPYLACVTVQQVFLDGKPVHSQAPDSEPTEWRSPSQAFELRQRPLSTAMPLDGKEKVLDSDPRKEIVKRAARAHEE